MRAVLSYILGIVGVLLVMWAARVLPSELGEMRREARNAEAVAERLEYGRAAFDADARAAVGEANEQAARLRAADGAALRRVEDALKQKRAAAERQLLDSAGLARAALTGNADAITASYRAQYLYIPLADRALKVAAARRSDLNTLTDINARIAAYNVLATQQRKRLESVAALEREVRAQRRNPLCRRIIVPVVCGKARELANLRSEIEREDAKLAAVRGPIERRRRAMRLGTSGVDDGRALIARANNAFAAEARKRGEQAGTHLLVAARRELERSGLFAVALVTAALLAGPLARTIAFLLLAPVAERARPLRLVSQGASSRLAAAGEVVEVAVGPATDLYLREGAQGGGAGTGARTIPRPLGRRLLTARGAGLAGVQLLRRDAHGLVAVAPFADAATDVAAVEVPPGGAIVFRPAALVGIVTPRGAVLPVRRLSRWRDARSWATFRFRHYVFAGPGTLLLQGRRGIRARGADGGWASDERLTIAYDAHLARGVRRRGSLWRFISGRQALFDESFAGHGFAYLEQLPSQSIAADPAGNLLRRIGDAMLKAVGL